MNELYHYNHNHDRLGRFARSPGGRGRNYIGTGGTGKSGDITKSDINKAKNQRKAERKRFRNMSDEDLQKRIDRMKLEQEYKNLTDADISAGKQYTMELLKTAGQTAVKTVTPNLINLGFDLVRKKNGVFKSK